MKQLLIKFFLLLISVNLVSCSTNTQNQNTLAGAGTGAVIGGLAGTLVTGGGRGIAIAAGAIVGAVAGGLIGKSMDSSDKTQMYSTMDNTPTNKTVVWKNMKTGKKYRVTPTSNKMSYKSHAVCRSYNVISNIDGKNQVVKGVVCRQSDGTWVTVSN